MVSHIVDGPPPPGLCLGGLGYCEVGVSLCARGAQQQAGQQIADKKKSGLAMLTGIHTVDYKQIFPALQAPREALNKSYVRDRGDLGLGQEGEDAV